MDRPVFQCSLGSHHGHSPSRGPRLWPCGSRHCLGYGARECPNDSQEAQENPIGYGIGYALTRGISWLPWWHGPNRVLTNSGRLGTIEIFKELWIRHHEAMEMVFRELYCRHSATLNPLMDKASSASEPPRRRQISVLLIPGSQVRILPGTPSRTFHRKRLRLFYSQKTSIFSAASP